MNKTMAGRALLTILPAIMLGVSSCSTSNSTESLSDRSSELKETPVALTNSAAPSAELTVGALIEEGVPGGMIIDMLTLDAEVVAIDHTNRTVSLLMPGGETVPATAGSEAVNFDQVQKGDRVKALVTEQLAIYIGDENAVAVDGAGGVAMLAEKGEQPGGVVAEQSRSTATITAIDLAAHTATLKFDDGESETVEVRPDVDLSKQKIGAKVVFEVTRIVALSVEKK